MALFKPAWMRKKPERRKAAVAKITDQNQLDLILNQSIHHDTQIQAARQLTDKFLLVQNVQKLAEASSSVDLIDALADKINDPMMLLELASRYRPDYTSFSDKWIDRAIELGDEGVFVQCIVRGYREEAALSLLGKITKTEHLADVAVAANSHEVSAAAINLIVDKEVLSNIVANTSTDTAVNISAIERIRELYGSEAALKPIARMFINARSSQKHQIVRGLKDDYLLTELGYQCEDLKFCLAIYDLLPGKTHGIRENALQLFSNGKDERVKAASNLIELLSQDEKSAKMFWRFLKKSKGFGHSDYTGKVHRDTGPGPANKDASAYGDCIVSEIVTAHTDVGFDIEIPPYPFD